MSILSTEKLSHSFDERKLFVNLNFNIEKGERFALVGVNGAGKSTLLKILAGKETPNEGKVVISKDLTLGYLDQNPNFSEFSTINDFIFDSSNETQKLIKEYEELIQQESYDEKEFANLTEKITAINAWEYEGKIKGILDRFGIKDFNKQINTLSGGQQKRLSLAQLLITDPDIYLLDEPTNHLDIETIEWLENFLTTGNKTIILITHDRYFLENVCTEIKELDNQTIYSYKGNYSHFLLKKAEREAQEEQENSKNLAFLRKELEWMQRQPKARGTKSKSRIDNFYDVKSKVKTKDSNTKLELNVEIQRQGNKILELSNIQKFYNGKPVIKDFSYIFKKGDRIGLAGKNGTGKSTFLNLITQQEKLDGGEINIGETTVFGYYTQSGIPLKEGERVIDSIKNIAEFIKLAGGEIITASQLLTKFLFSPEKQYTLIEKLSGGEKKRLQLLMVLIKNPNFLILDEPSNDLDIDTLNILEDFLNQYKGVLLIVSHDRYLLDKLTDQLFIFSENGIPTIYNGNYSDFKTEEEAKLKELKAKELSKRISKETLKPVEKTRKLSYKEERELEELEEIISSLETSINDKSALLSETTKTEEILALAEELEEIQQNLDNKLERWFELSDKQ